MSKRTNSKLYIYIFLALISILIVAGIGIQFISSTKQLAPTPQPTTALITTSTKTTLTPAVTPMTIQTGDGSYATTTNVPGQMKFVSPKLGISFLYANRDPGYGGNTALVKEDGNTVYIYVNYKGIDYHKDSLSVQVFDKNPNDDLLTTVKTMFLKGFSDSDCVAEANARKAYINPSMDVSQVRIRPPFIGEEDLLHYLERVSKCPTPYTEANGIMYFVMDKKHPSKFMFLNLGQSGIPAAPLGNSDDRTWEQTIQLTN